MRSFPDVIRIEPAGICNFKCRHCPIGTEGGHRVILPWEKFVKYFNSLPLVPRVLVLYHGGEPLLNKNLERMIAYAKGMGVQKVVFNTNASLLSSKRDLSQVDELRVSFDGDNATMNDYIRVGSNFEKHAAQVRELALSNKCPKVIKIYNARHGTNQVAQYLRDYFSDCPNMLYEGIQIRTWARMKNEPLPPRDGVTHCTALMETFTILSNGDVPMCCEDLQGDDIVGNVNQNSPTELWERMETRRLAFARKEYPQLCQSCFVVTG
jgi:radical SAM protein with 4Fe4S-binding SPASM domain